MKQFIAEIISNNRKAHDFFELKFRYPTNAPGPKPGQFLTLRVSELTSPLLRRPFAFSSWDSHGEASVMYQKRGPATSIISALEDGDTVDIIAPLGNSFIVPDLEHHPVLVAGGIGIGPILYFSDFLASQKHGHTLIIGARNEAHMPFVESHPLRNLILCSDDGSIGQKANTVEIFRQQTRNERSIFVSYGCGPNGMLKALQQSAADESIPCYVSMEQTMACGVGACMGCVVPVKSDNQYARVCKDGPIFDGKDIAWTLL